MVTTAEARKREIEKQCDMIDGERIVVQRNRSNNKGKKRGEDEREGIMMIRNSCHVWTGGISEERDEQGGGIRVRNKIIVRWSEEPSTVRLITVS